MDTERTELMSTRSFPRIVSLCDEGYRLDYGDMNEANARLISACGHLRAVAIVMLLDMGRCPDGRPH